MKKNAEEYFKQCQKMVQKIAWEVALNWNMDFAELEAQGYLIFMEALEKYEEGRASFPTFLYHQLRGLNDYCERECRIQSKAVSVIEDDTEYTRENTEETPHVSKGILEEAKLLEDPFARFEEVLDFKESLTVLSEDAKEVLSFIFYGDWGKPGTKWLASKNAAQESFRKTKGWTFERTGFAWKEVLNWYGTLQTA